MWTAPANLGPTINAVADEDQLWGDPLGTSWLNFNLDGSFELATPVD